MYIYMYLFVYVYIHVYKHMYMYSHCCLEDLTSEPHTSFRQVLVILDGSKNSPKKGIFESASGATRSDNSLSRPRTCQTELAVVDN